MAVDAARGRAAPGSRTSTRRVVRARGQPRRRSGCSREVFEVGDRAVARHRRHPASGLGLRAGVRRLRRRAPLRRRGSVRAEESPECIAGEVLRGRKKPHECPAFGTQCTPEHPLGAPMVSAEGACAAYYRYGRRRAPRSRDDRRAAVLRRPRLPGAPDAATRPCSSSHGGGGRHDRRRSSSACSCRRFATPRWRALHDGAVLRRAAGRLAFTTDSYVVRPIFFPGGDIGSLAVHGTVNDLAMCGARPAGPLRGLHPRGGLPARRPRARRRLDARRGRGRRRPDRHRRHEGRRPRQGRRHLHQHGRHRRRARRRGHRARPARAPATSSCSRGAIALHGIAILSVREGLAFETTIESDSAALHDARGAPSSAAGGPSVHVLRDPTRGGVASRHERDRRVGGPRDRSSTSGRSRSARRSAARARSSASTRSTSRTRARRSRSSPPRSPTRCSPRCARTRSAARPRSSAASTQGPPGRVTMRSRIGGTRARRHAVGGAAAADLLTGRAACRAPRGPARIVYFATWTAGTFHAPVAAASSGQ